MAVGSLACALTGNFSQLFICRLIQGIGVGGEMPVAATYINELSRAHGRGRFFLLYELIFPFGFLAAGLLGARLVPIYGWQSLFVLGTVPGLIITYLVLRLPESPRWLIGQGRLAEADSIIRQIEASTDKRNPVAVAPRYGRPGQEEPLGRIVLAGLSAPDADRVGDLGDGLWRHQRPEQLDGDALHHGLSPSAPDRAECGVADQRHADPGSGGLHSSSSTRSDAGSG